MSLLRFKKEEFIDKISRFLSVSKKQKDAFTRALMIDPQPEGPCLLWVNTVETRFRAEIPVYNDSDRLVKPVVLEMRPFYELVKGSDGEFITIQEENRKHRLCVRSGTIDLENFYRMSPRIKDEEFWSPRAYKTAQGSTQALLRFLAIADRSMIFALIASHRRACIHEGIAYMNFNNVVVTVDFKDSGLSSLGFRAADFKVLKKSLEGSESFSIFPHCNSYMIDTGSLKVSVPFVDFRDLYYVREGIEHYDVKYSIDIPFKSLYDTIMFVSKATGPSDVVAIECRSGNVWIEANTKIGRNLSFPIADGIRTVFAIRLSVDLLKKVLVLMNFVVDKDDTLKISSGVDGRVVFESERIKITAGACR